ncbi:hypothetical protein Syn7502_02042 [Synechococcus sp. PCC 7502]|uniref:low-complexity tail membrane protein n=1 Tax=Synechococcus sp. PCC 7502 TaxID=1173263 RepID=UPI00029FE315|nr:low-complexity tail membrane protein [Synechococcus sp. PCC 7502]AFY74066.1 hypothetical protein Syn7502_02042 [Synechococcus sp. PCC 7502]
MAQQELSNGNVLNSNYQKAEPFLWFHIALLAAVPLTLVIGMLGLGVGDPVLPEWLEITVLGLPPIALPVILQWWKPLSPFSVWLFAKPLELTDDNERRILTVVKEFKTVLVAIALGVLIDAIFCKIYAGAPLVENVLPLPDGLRIIGIIWWLAFFLVSNLLLQAGAVAIRVLLRSEADLNQLNPLPIENINSAFTSLGKRSPRLLYLISDSHIQEAILEPKPKDQTQSRKDTPTVKPEVKTPEITQPKPVSETIPEEPIPIVEPVSAPNAIAPEVAIDNPVNNTSDTEVLTSDGKEPQAESPESEVTNLVETLVPITPDIEAPQSAPITEAIQVSIEVPIPTPPEPVVTNLEVPTVPTAEPESPPTEGDIVNQDAITEQLLIRTKEIIAKAEVVSPKISTEDSPTTSEENSAISSNEFNPNTETVPEIESASPTTPTSES